jgi:hypothetical protein
VLGPGVGREEEEELERLPVRGVRSVVAGWRGSSRSERSAGRDVALVYMVVVGVVWEWYGIDKCNGAHGKSQGCG